MWQLLLIWELFQSTPSAWRETRGSRVSSYPILAFQSTPSAWRETTSILVGELAKILFQSTPSAWRETLTGTKNDGFMLVFQSTPSAWRETQGRPAAYRRSFISIHSLRMEGDFFKGVMTWENVGISIHSLRMEGDLFNTALADQPIIFQSTPSAWRETERSHPANGEPAYFNPLPPHGGRHQWAVTFG